MSKYDVFLSGIRYVTARVEVEADSEQEAMKIADDGWTEDYEWDCDTATENIQTEHAVLLKEAVYR